MFSALKLAGKAKQQEHGY